MASILPKIAEHHKLAAEHHEAAAEHHNQAAKHAEAGRLMPSITPATRNKSSRLMRVVAAPPTLCDRNEGRRIIRRAR